ncbi:hypothetical protein COZ55_01380 [archaeon CG_4_8_14_3_um_filter_38_5]|nr:MAG: hypothetical protein COZ55_01380 [archaeon CG_4_8_14_3_um_filter_38_5]
MGLMIKSISNVLMKKEIPDPMENISETLLDGLKYLIFAGIISIPLIIITWLTFGALIVSMITSFSASAQMMSTAMFLIMQWIPALVILTLIYLLILPPLTVNYAEKKKFSAFFDIAKAFRVIFNNFGDWLRMLLITFVYSVGITIVGLLVSFTFIGVLLIPPISLLVSAKILGEWFADNAK